MQFYRAARRRRSASAGQRARQRTAAELAPRTGPSRSRRRPSDRRAADSDLGGQRTWRGRCLSTDRWENTMSDDARYEETERWQR